MSLRLKKGTPSTHPLREPELRALRQLKWEYPDSPYLFQTERKGPMTDRTARNQDLRNCHTRCALRYALRAYR